jgi:hypothetical protein
MKPTEIMTATFRQNACKENTKSLLRKAKCEIYQGFRRNMGKERLVQNEVLTISTVMLAKSSKSLRLTITTSVFVNL